MNLLNETLKVLERHGKTMMDIEWIGSDQFRISEEDFYRLANIEYDSGFGKQEIASDLVLVGEDFYLERAEYDGCEHWVMKTIPDKPDELRSVHSLISKYGWETLDEINKEA